MLLLLLLLLLFLYLSDRDWDWDGDKIVPNLGSPFSPKVPLKSSSTLSMSVLCGELYVLSMALLRGEEEDENVVLIVFVFVLVFVLVCVVFIVFLIGKERFLDRVGEAEGEYVLSVRTVTVAESITGTIRFLPFSAEEVEDEEDEVEEEEE